MYKPKNNITIIGAGNAVVHRILPALDAVGYDRGQIKVFSARPAGQPAQTPNLHDELLKRSVSEVTWFDNQPDANGLIPSLAKCAAECVDRRSPVIIATPSFSHLAYTNVMLDRGAIVAVENPLVCTPKDLAALDELAKSGKERRVFALGQYRLERALPLLQFMQPFAVPAAGMVTLQDSIGFLYLATQVDKIGETRGSLGKILGVEFLLLEGKNDSVPLGNPRISWQEDTRFGGTLFETFVHNMAMAEIVVGVPNKWKNINWNFAVRAERKNLHPEILPTYIDLSARVDDADIRLICGKHVPDQFTYRGGRIKFENGEAWMNLDTQVLDVFKHDFEPPILTMNISPPYFRNYHVQMELFQRFVTGHGISGRFDGFRQQIETLRFLTGARQHQQSLPIYDDHSGPETLSGFGVARDRLHHPRR